MRTNKEPVLRRTWAGERTITERASVEKEEPQGKKERGGGGM